MLDVKRSGDITLEMNLRNPLHACDEASNKGVHPGFETKGRSSKQGVSVAP